jgi:hypothetical protein
MDFGESAWSVSYPSKDLFGGVDPPLTVEELVDFVAVDITKQLRCEVLKEFGAVRSTCRYMQNQNIKCHRHYTRKCHTGESFKRTLDEGYVILSSTEWNSFDRFLEKD